MCKIMLSAGEASGDLHGAGIAAALRAMKPDVRLLAWAAQPCAAKAWTFSMILPTWALLA